MQIKWKNINSQSAITLHGSLTCACSLTHTLQLLIMNKEMETKLMWHFHGAVENRLCSTQSHEVQTSPNWPGRPVFHIETPGGSSVHRRKGISLLFTGNRDEIIMIIPTWEAANQKCWHTRCRVATLFPVCLEEIWFGKWCQITTQLGMQMIH